MILLDGKRRLSQEIFVGQPRWVKSAAVDANGDAYFYSIYKKELKLRDEDLFWHYLCLPEATCKYIGGSFDCEDWRNSAIDRVLDTDL